MPAITDRDLLTILAHLRGIHEQSGEMTALLTGLEQLPPTLAAEAVRVLGRLEDELSALTQQLGEARPG
jgi:hypothetical protein